MKISDAPLHQNRWRVLVDAPFGERSGGWSSDVLSHVSFGTRGERRFLIEVTPAEAVELRAWLDEMLRPREGIAV